MKGIMVQLTIVVKIKITSLSIAKKKKNNYYAFQASFKLDVPPRIHDFKAQNELFSLELQTFT